MNQGIQLSSSVRETSSILASAAEGGRVQHTRQRLSVEVEVGSTLLLGGCQERGGGGEVMLMGTGTNLNEQLVPL